MFKNTITKIAIIIHVAFFALVTFTTSVEAQSAPSVNPVIYNGGNGFRVLTNDGDDMCSGNELYFVALENGSTVGYAGGDLPDNSLERLIAINLEGLNLGDPFTFQAVFISNAAACSFDWNNYNGSPEGNSGLTVVMSNEFEYGTPDCDGGRCPDARGASPDFVNGQFTLRVSNIFDDGACSGTYSIRFGDTTLAHDSASGQGSSCTLLYDTSLTDYMSAKADSAADKTYREELEITWESTYIAHVTLCYNATTSTGRVGRCPAGVPDPDDPDGEEGGDLQVTIDKNCDNLGSAADRDSCHACFEKNDGDSTSAFVWSELGCFDTSQNGFTVRIFQIGFGLYGGIVVVKVGIAALAMQDRDPAKIKEFRETVNAAFWALAALAGAIPILQFLGLNVLGIFPSNFFT